jgi:hypothetical protein
MQLVAQELKLLDEEQLLKALESKGSHVRELEAKARFEEAMNLLKSVASEYDGTQAAQMSNVLLKVQQEGNRPAKGILE